MHRSDKRILTTHVGSLIRPKELLELTHAPVEGGQVSSASRGVNYAREPGDPVYRDVLRNAVKDVVRRQAEAGVDVVSDGEFGKSSWAAYILERITGFQKQPDRLSPLRWLGSDRERFREVWEAEMPAALTGVPADVVVGPITYKGQDAIQRDIDNFKAALAEVQVTVNEALELEGVDHLGLDDLDRRYLKTLINQERPAGVATLAAAMQQEVDTLEDVVEPYLLYESFIVRTSGGRQPTPKAFAHLGLRPPGRQSAQQPLPLETAND